MLIIGCDFHTRYQQVAMMDDATGESVERRLEHGSSEAESFAVANEIVGRRTIAAVKTGQERRADIAITEPCRPRRLRRRKERFFGDPRRIASE